MKMIITCRRNPALTRQAFFYHLRHVHWPMVRDCQATRAGLKGYIQNHALGPQGPVDGTPDRDSVIELFFDDEAALHRMVQDPDYCARIRPDEARFNDLPHNVMVKTTAQTLFAAPVVGRCKRFDFLMRAPGMPADDFRAHLAQQGDRLALDPWYTAMIDRQDHNLRIAGADGQGFGSSAFDAVRECWAGDFDRLAATATLPGDDLPIDRHQSFSVYATQFTML